MQDALFRVNEWTRLYILCLATTCLGLGISPARGEDLFDLSLEQLMTLEVSSVSRKAEWLVDAPAAIYVISREQIRTAGATTIPDALRLAPGVHVAQIDANKWAVSARGFNGRFANKLLVLIDGRSVYTPLFSGVFWDAQDAVLEDIERIEVIRGPGATLWGANAVNGVINIITRSAQDTTGTVFALRHGNLEPAYGMLRHGSQLGDGAHYRVYGKYFERDGHLNSYDGRSADGWDALRLGARLDWRQQPGSELTLNAEMFKVESVEMLALTVPQAPFVDRRNSRQTSNGGHAMLRWQRKHDDRQSSLQMSWQTSDRQGDLFNETRHTVALEYQQQRPIGDVHDLIWGLGYRWTTDDTAGSFAFTVEPSSRSADLTSLFVQNTMRIDDDWQFIAGAKFEHNSYTGSEFQPNLRVIGKLTEGSRIWGAVSRAVRVPSRVEYDGQLVPPSGILAPGDELNPFPVAAVSVIQGNENTAAEELLAYEFGYRIQASDRLQFDVAAFLNDYRFAGSDSPGREPYCAPSGVPISADVDCFLGASYIAVPTSIGSAYRVGTRGLEVAADWQVVDNWQLGLVASWQQSDNLFLSHGQSSADRMATLTSSFAFGDRWQAYSAIRYVGSVSMPDIDSYLALDLRLAWLVSESLEVSLDGRTLNDPVHPEFESELGDIAPTEIRRGVYLQARWNFGR